MRLGALALVVLATALSVSLGGVPAGASGSTFARPAAVKKGCPAKRRHESRRARARRRACVKRRRRRTVWVPAAPGSALVTPLKPPATADVPAALGAPGAAATAPDAPAAPAPAATAPVLSALGVDAVDAGGFSLRLTRVTIPVGTLTIYYRNRDSSLHNLWIDGPGADAPVLVTDAVGENATATKKVAVSAGAWRLFCSLPGHESMTATVTVG